ncbi:MAG: hypothetical protein HY067_04805 [Betaproteobacteria bacterium]|nr:hypothetical protein [Betaproteobacteria bacterium]
MYTEIAAAIQSTKTAIEIVKAAHGLSNHLELLTAVTAIQEKLTDAIASELASQEKQAQLQERVRQLEKQLAEVEDWKNEMQRYHLMEFPATGTFAYALKPEMAQGQPLHYLCTSCVDRKQKSTLQPNGRSLRCPACKIDIAIKEVDLPTVRRRPTPRI